MVTQRLVCQAHNLEVVGSNPVLVTKNYKNYAMIVISSNFFSALSELICSYIDTSHEEERCLAEQNRIRREKERYEKECKYEEIWKQATKESHENSDEWKILPYGWSSFGIFI